MPAPGVGRDVPPMEELPSYRPHRRGARGERLAAARLEAEGWKVLARNYRFGRREIDLVVRRGATLAFVEVKTRSGDGFGGPLAAVTWRKRREIQAVATHFLARMGPREVEGLDIRFDVVAITVRRDGCVAGVEHIEDAWRPDG